MHIGEKLRELRESKDLSQGQIEKRTGLFRVYISRIENGHTVPAIETLEKLARALEVRTYPAFPESIYKGREFRGGSKPASWFSSSSIVTMVQPAESFRNKDGTRSRHT